MKNYPYFYKYFVLTTLFFIVFTTSQFAYESGRISAGKDYSLYIDNNSTVWAWGNNFSGKLGDNTTTDKIYPIKIEHLQGKNIKRVLAGCNNSFAVDQNNNLWAWGENLLNYLGVGLGNDEIEECCQEYSGPLYKNEIYTPTIIKDVKKVYDVTSSCNHSLILTNNDEFKVYAWGEGYMGQLGINDRNRSYVYTPMEAYNLQDVIEVSAGNSFSLALRSDGNVYTWGDNKYGQLGTNFVPFPPANELFLMPLRTIINNLINYTSEYTIIPIEASKPENIVDPQIYHIAAGGDHALALVVDNQNNTSLWAWGRNDMGQLGNRKTYEYTNIPTMVSLPDNITITEISAGQNHSLALDSDGNVWAWGDNSYKQIGNTNISENMNYCTIPTKVEGLSNVVEISAGAYHNLALTKDGKIYGWGNNTYGQLGKYKNTLNIALPEEINIEEQDQPNYILPRLAP